MDKRTIAALVIGVIFLIGYPYYMKAFNPAPEEEVVATEEVVGGDKDAGGGIMEAAPEGRAEEQGGGGGILDSITGSISNPFSMASTEPVDYEPRPKAPMAEGEAVVVVTPLYKAVFSTNGGGVRSFELKGYKQRMSEGSSLIDLAEEIDGEYPLNTRVKLGDTLHDVSFQASRHSLLLSGKESGSIDFTWVSPEGVRLIKSYTFKADGYSIDSKIRVVNGSGSKVEGTVATVLTAYYPGEYQRFHSGPVTYVTKEADREDISGAGPVKWLGLEDKFFLLALIPDSSKNEAVIRWKQEHLLNDDEETVGARTILAYPVKLATASESTYSGSTFMGPKEYDLLLAKKVNLEAAIEFGFFAFMAKPALVILNFFERYVGNYGLAIIILTILIKIVFHPLTKKSLNSMKDMQLLQPQMKALREKHKEDKQQQNKEIMALYKRHKVNPVGGCLPMVLQIPVFIALYEVLGVAIELRHAPFMFWLTDLSSQDPYYITPIFMGITMFIQQKLTPSTMDPTQAKMMLLMPVVFTVLFLSFPSGLVLYWIVNNLITIGQHWQIHKVKA